MAEPAAASSLPDLRTMQHWLDRCIAHLQQQQQVAALREYRRADFAHLPLHDVRLRLSTGLVHTPLPADYAPQQMHAITAQLCSAALWRLITDPYMTELYWYRPLAVLSSTALARRARQTYRQYIRQYTAHAAVAPDRDALYRSLAHDVTADPALHSGVLALLDDLRDPAHGRPMLAQALGTARRQPASERVAAALPATAPPVAAEPVPDDQLFPITVGQWRFEVEQRKSRSGHLPGYWCYLRPARYPIGGWDAEAEPAYVRIKQGFWVSRFPITQQQFAVFAAIGYQDAARDWWTAQGWQWREQHPDRAKQWIVSAATALLPALVTWYEARAFARWLTAQLGGMLPTGMLLRLPAEAEWEIAAACDARGTRQTYPWGNQDREEDAAPAASEQPPPVAATPALLAACGAAQMTGSVWQWTTTDATQYPKDSDIILTDPDTTTSIAIRGGGTDRRCGVREHALPPATAAFRLVLTRTADRAGFG